MCTKILTILCHVQLYINLRISIGAAQTGAVGDIPHAYMSIGCSTTACQQT